MRPVRLLLPALLLLGLLTPLLAVGPVPAGAQETPAPSPTTAAPAGASSSATATVATTSPLPTPTTVEVVHADVFPQVPVLSVTPSLLVAGGTAVVQVRASSGQRVDLYAYTRPSTTLRLVRSGFADTEGLLAWTVRPTASTRFVARTSDLVSPPLVLPVARRLTFALGTADGCELFSGAVYPAAAGEGGVSVVRSVDERNVLLAVAPVDPLTGRYAVRRCLTGDTSYLSLAARLPRSPTWVDLPAATVLRAADCLPGPCLPGPDVVAETEFPDVAFTTDLERGQGLLLKVRSDPSTGHRVDARTSGTSLAGPERSFVADPVPAGEVRPGRGGRVFFRWVGVRRGLSTVVVTSTPPDGGAPRVLRRVQVTVR